MLCQKAFISMQVKAEEFDIQSVAVPSDNLIDFTDPTPLVSINTFFFFQFMFIKLTFLFLWGRLHKWGLSESKLLYPNPQNTLYLTWCQWKNKDLAQKNSTHFLDIYVYLLYVTLVLWLYSSFHQCSIPNLSSHLAGSFLQQLWVVCLNDKKFYLR